MSRPRVLVLSAPVGGSHDAMARALSATLVRCAPEVETVVVSSTASQGAVIERLVLRPARLHMDRVGWTYGGAYRVTMATQLGWRVSSGALNGLARRTLSELVSESGADVVVSSYPMTTTVLGYLRRTGRLGVPVCGIVGPLGGLRPWCAEGVDRHLVQYPEAVEAVRRLAGRGDVRVIRPLVNEAFFRPVARRSARRQLGLDGDGPVVLISGGGWGVGDVVGAVRAALTLADVKVAVVTGRNDALHARLARLFHDQPVRVLGYTDRMSPLLAAADAFVCATAGLSCLEARLRGCPTVCYGFPVAHVRDNARALAEAGLVLAARDPEQLAGRLHEALAGRFTVPAPPPRAPTAGQLVAELIARSGPVAPRRSIVLPSA